MFKLQRLDYAAFTLVIMIFSDPRKTALVDMGFNLGVPTLKEVFVNFNDAVNRGDWNTAADESHRTLNQRGDKRNKDTYDQLRYNR